MSVEHNFVSLKNSIAVALLGLGASVATQAAPASGSAYFTDTQTSHVEDATSKGIGQVNMITCLMSAMRPDALVNQGNYIALVDEAKCDPQSQSSASNAGASSGAQATNYTTTTINSTRASNSDPMLVKIWLNETSDEQASTIFVHISATEAPSVGNPYGQFRLDFCGKAADGSGSCMMQGFLQGSNGGLNYYQNEQRDGNGSSTVALRLSSVGTTSGSGRLDMTRVENNTTDNQVFSFAYDSTHFLRGDQCFSRDATDPETGLSVWRYGVYDSVSGDRITRNSGFPINYTAGGETYHGYLGYYGLSLPATALNSLTNGATVQKIDYSNGNAPTTTNYTVTKAGGKLTKYTRKTRTLHSLDQIDISTFVGNVTGFFVGATPNIQYTMHWDEALQSFVVTGAMECNQNGCQSHSLDTPHTVSASFWQTNGGVQGWSQSLGGEVYVDLHAVTLPLDSNAVTVSYRTQDLVYPSQLPATLYCVNNCPTATALSSYFAPGSSDASPYTANTYNHFNPNPAFVTYGSDAVNAVLTSSGQAVVYTDASGYQQHPQFQQGVRSGRLVTDLNALLCGSGVYCDYKANELDVYYVWETGPNNWNQFAAVRDTNNAFVQFDAPMQLSFTVPTGAQYGQYQGKTLVLQYGGFGELWGIPGQCVSSLTNQPISCDQDNARYVPEFVIPYDATLGQVSDGMHTYLVKWMDREIRFARKSLSACSNLTLPSGVVLPTQADLKDTTNPNSDVYIGAQPVVTTQPRVVHGEVKY